MTLRLEDIQFDENDKNLFQIDDLRLKADALKHSLLPKLHVVLNECVAAISKVYGIDVFEHCSISQSPNFRTKRKTELKTDYSWATVSLTGKRLKNKWRAVIRENGKPSEFSPFAYHLWLDENGVEIWLSLLDMKELDARLYRKISDFFLEHESLIYTLCNYAGLHRRFFNSGESGPILTLEEDFRLMIQAENFDFELFSEVKPYPIVIDSLNQIVFEYVCFYPIFDSYIQIGLGKKPRFKKLVDLLNRELVEINKKETSEELPLVTPNRNQGSDGGVKTKEMAEQKIRVMPAMRWQVFARDEWKCVACGRTAHDSIVLQVDHITPRSKGGKDLLDNYQTLCNECNLGKSNKDSVNLRRKPKS